MPLHKQIFPESVTCRTLINISWLSVAIFRAVQNAMLGAPQQTERLEPQIWVHRANLQQHEQRTIDNAPYDRLFCGWVNLRCWNSMLRTWNIWHR